jgi:hypothetical protein
VDAGTSVDRVERVVAHLEQEGLTRSELDHEREFTWVRGDVKVQLIRPYHPFPKGAAGGLPVNNILPELDAHRWLVAFADDPTRGYLWAARPAALVGLKEMAFGRTRPDGAPVDRDFSDVALLFDRLEEQIVEEVAADAQMRRRVIRAATTLYSEFDAASAAGRELVASGQEETQLAAEAMVSRAARGILRQLS